MTLEIKVGVPTLTVHRGYTLAASEPDGQMHEGGDRGLYFLDTRLISVWELSANDKPWTLLNSGALAASAGRIYLTNPDLRSEGGIIPVQSLGFVFGRRVEGGMHEDMDIANYGAKTAKFDLALSVASDFADLFEVKGNTVTRRGKIVSDWLADDQTLTTRYHNKDFSRAFRVGAKNARSPMPLANGQLRFAIELAPGEKWHGCLFYDFADGDIWSKAPSSCVADYEASEAAQQQKAWRSSVLKVEASDTGFARAFSQALNDMAALRLPIEGTDQIKFVPAAGLPWFVALFGRDSLVISLQASIVHAIIRFGVSYSLTAYRSNT